MGNCLPRRRNARIQEVIDFRSEKMANQRAQGNNKLREYGPTVKSENFELMYYNYNGPVQRCEKLTPSDLLICCYGYTIWPQPLYRLKSKNVPKDMFIWDEGCLIKINAGKFTYSCRRCGNIIDPLIIQKGGRYMIKYGGPKNLTWSVMSCPLDPSISSLSFVETYLIFVPGFGQVLVLPYNVCIIYLPGINLIPQRARGWFYTYKVEDSRRSLGVFTNKTNEDVLIIFDNGETLKPVIMPLKFNNGKISDYSAGVRYDTEEGYILISNTLDNAEYHTAKIRGKHTKMALRHEEEQGPDFATIF